MTKAAKQQQVSPASKTKAAALSGLVDDPDIVVTVSPTGLLRVEGVSEAMTQQIGQERVDEIVKARTACLELSCELVTILISRYVTQSIRDDEVRSVVDRHLEQCFRCRAKRSMLELALDMEIEERRLRGKKPQ